MLDFKKFLVELYNRPVKWEKHGIDYYFQVDGHEYVVNFETIGSTHFELVFSYFNPKTNGWTTDKVDLGSTIAITVLSTVLDIAKDFMKYMQPESLEFTATGQSRINIYAQMSKSFIPAGYRMEVRKFHDITAFAINKISKM